MKRPIVILIVAVGILYSGCDMNSQDESIEDESPTGTSVQSFAALETGEIQTLTFTPTIRSTITATTTSTPVPINTISAVTLQPTLEYLNRYMGEGQSYYLCWWNLCRNGRLRDLEHAIELLQTLDPNLEVNYSSDGEVTVHANIPYTDELTDNGLMKIEIMFDGSRIRFVDVMNMPQQYPYRYSIRHIFGLGPPDDVLVLNFISDSIPTVYLIVDFESDGIYAIYKGLTDEIDSGIRTCFRARPDHYLIVDRGSWSLEEILEYIGVPQEYSDEALSVQSVLNMSPIEFVYEFSTGGNFPCVILTD